jgi:hypothetical protein
MKDKSFSVHRSAFLVHTLIEGLAALAISVIIAPLQIP